MILERVSASQVKAFRQCQRVWYNQTVLKLRQPQTPAMERGTAVHAGVEWNLTSGLCGKQPDKQIGNTTLAEIEKLVAAQTEALLTIVPDWYARHGSGAALVEHGIDVPTYLGGPRWIGFLDNAVLDRRPLLTADLKTSSDFRYSKTPEELLADPQMIAYGHYLHNLYAHAPGEIAALEAKIAKLEKDGDAIAPRLIAKARAKVLATVTQPIDAVEVGHLYVLTKVPKTKPAKTLWVSATMTAGRAESEWAAMMPDVRAMVAWAAEEPKTADPLPPTPEACSMYGGCPYRSRCGHVGGSATSMLRRVEGAPANLHPPVTNIPRRDDMSATPTDGKNGTDPTSTSPLLARLRARNAAPEQAPAAPAPSPAPPAAAPEAPAAAPPAAAPPPAEGGLTARLRGKKATGVLPPDAPPRTTPIAPPPAQGVLQALGVVKKPTLLLEVPAEDGADDAAAAADEIVRIAAESVGPGKLTREMAVDLVKTQGAEMALKIIKDEATKLRVAREEVADRFVADKKVRDATEAARLAAVVDKKARDAEEAALETGRKAARDEAVAAAQARTEAEYRARDVEEAHAAARAARGKPDVVPVEDSLRRHTIMGDPGAQVTPEALRAAESVVAKSVAAVASSLRPTPEDLRAAEALHAPTPGAPRRFAGGANGAEGFSLFIDCWPGKGFPQPTLFEEWIAPILAEAAAMGGCDDYRLIQFGQGKAAVAKAVKRHIQEVPEILVIPSFASGATEALEVLVPFARFVTRGMRG